MVRHLTLRQLERLAGVEGSALRIDNVEEKAASEEALKIDISIDCIHYVRNNNGLPLNPRESLRLWIPAAFPYRLPSATAAHTRFAGFLHVQWGNQLCLYQSTEVQWQPSSGLIGYMEQLNRWFEKAAINELDEPEGPLHPPVAYQGSDTAICVYADTPGPDQWPWFGAALIEPTKPQLWSLTGWAEVGAIGKGRAFGPALLLDFELTFEYPRTVRDLLRYIEVKGIETTKVLVHLMIAAEEIQDGEPMHVVVGAPSRGVAGDQAQRSQHLQVWEIAAEDLMKLKLASLSCDVMRKFEGQEKPEALRALIDSVFDDLFKWQSQSRILWCRVIENRPEIVTRRDKGSAMDWFKDKSVSVWGCGALGGVIAEHLVRAGVKRLVLYDSKRASPGILVRQNFEIDDINEGKAEALTRRLRRISGSVAIDAHAMDLLRDGVIKSQLDSDVDVIIDATASLNVRSKLEADLRVCQNRPPIGVVMVSGAAQHGAVVLSPAGYSGGTLDVLRKMGLSARNRSWLKDWVDAFWKSDTSEAPRQPEPGCSDPTFVGSHADVAGLAARMINRIAKVLANCSTDAMGCLLAQDSVDKPDQVFCFVPDIVIYGDNLEFRLSQAAWRDVRAWIRAGARERSHECETGGLVFGQFDEVLGVGWISNVSGPPEDSQFSPEGFVCGTAGIRELCDQYEQRSLGMNVYVGTWHSHPATSARPSSTDYGGIGAIFADTQNRGVHQLMLIAGHACEAGNEIGVYVFEKTQLKRRELKATLAMTIQGGVTAAPHVQRMGKSIGLALSGGGSRAVAFHLGTLRALDDLQLLDDVDVISGVSGGSVMSGLLGYSDESMSVIDKKTVEFLRKGLVKPGLVKLAHPARLTKVAIAFTTVALPTLVVGVVRTLLHRIASLFPGSARTNALIEKVRWPFRRWYSRTQVIADAITDVIGSDRCNAATRGGKNVVFNACELRTGTAFRISNKKFGSWRFGWADSGKLRVADAVAASAAYPPFLPPFDWRFSFSKKGTETLARVIVTDGGVFENLGVSVMEPGRDTSFSSISFRPEIIIASDAGTGQFSGKDLPNSWPVRMVQVVNTVMRKVQDATKNRLHRHAAAGRIDAFVYANLGQIDERVPIKSVNWIPRDKVVNYPTDFSSMSEDNIRALSGRGEAITRALVTQYLLSE